MYAYAPHNGARSTAAGHVCVAEAVASPCLDYDFVGLDDGLLRPLPVQALPQGIPVDWMSFSGDFEDGDNSVTLGDAFGTAADFALDSRAASDVVNLVEERADRPSEPAGSIESTDPSKEWQHAPRLAQLPTASSAGASREPQDQIHPHCPDVVGSDVATVIPVLVAVREPVHRKPRVEPQSVPAYDVRDDPAAVATEDEQVVRGDEQIRSSQLLPPTDGHPVVCSALLLCHQPQPRTTVPHPRVRASLHVSVNMRCSAAAGCTWTHRSRCGTARTRARHDGKSPEVRWKSGFT
jgi:hypothetical protein